MCKLSLFLIASISQVIIQQPKIITAFPVGDAIDNENNEVNSREVPENEVNPVILLEAGGKKFLISNSPTVQFKQLYIPKFTSKKKYQHKAKSSYDNSKKKSINLKKPTSFLDEARDSTTVTLERNTNAGEIIVSKISPNSVELIKSVKRATEGDVLMETPGTHADVELTTGILLTTEEECYTSETSTFTSTERTTSKIQTTEALTTTEIPTTTMEILTTTERYDTYVTKKYDKPIKNDKKEADIYKKLRLNQNAIKNPASKLGLVQKRNTKDKSKEDNDVVSLPAAIKPKTKMTLAERLENETSVEKAERIHRGFQRMIQFVNIVGQVDQYLSSRARSAVKKLALLCDEDDAYDRRNTRRHARY